jgi:hypothetical protein
VGHVERQHENTDEEFGAGDDVVHRNVLED